MSSKRFFNKSIATALSLATLLTTVSPCTLAAGTIKGKTEKSLSTTAKTVIAGVRVGALAIATGGIIYYMSRDKDNNENNDEKSIVYVEHLNQEEQQLYNNLADAVKDLNVNVVNTILKSNKNLDVNARFENNKTLLHMLATSQTTQLRTIKENTTEIFKLLVKKGADINAKDETGLTPLHDAVGLKNNVHMCELLLMQKNINVNVSGGWRLISNMEILYVTPIQLCVLLSPHRVKEALIILEKATNLDITPLAANTTLIDIIDEYISKCKPTDVINGFNSVQDAIDALNALKCALEKKGVKSSLNKVVCN